MNKDLTDIICILDKSGSMHGKESDVIGGFNKFLEDQKAEAGNARITLVLFNHNYNTVYKSRDIRECSPLTTKDYIVEGGTSLLDAVGKAINDKVQELVSPNTEVNLFDDTRNIVMDLAGDTNPEKVIVVIITDGEENGSNIYSKTQIKSLTEKLQTEKNWLFMYLGADINAFQEAAAMGIDPAFSRRYMADNIQNAYQAISTSSSTYRSSGGRIRTSAVLTNALNQDPNLNNNNTNT